MKKKRAACWAVLFAESFFGQAPLTVLGGWQYTQKNEFPSQGGPCKFRKRAGEATYGSKRIPSGIAGPYIGCSVQ